MKEGKSHSYRKPKSPNTKQTLNSSKRFSVDQSKSWQRHFKDRKIPRDKTEHLAVSQKSAASSLSTESFVTLQKEPGWVQRQRAAGVASEQTTRFYSAEHLLFARQSVWWCGGTKGVRADPNIIKYGFVKFRCCLPGERSRLTWQVFVLMTGGTQHGRNNYSGWQTGKLNYLLKLRWPFKSFHRPANDCGKSSFMAPTAAVVVMRSCLLHDLNMKAS